MLLPQWLINLFIIAGGIVSIGGILGLLWAVYRLFEPLVTVKETFKTIRNEIIGIRQELVIASTVSKKAIRSANTAKRAATVTHTLVQSLSTDLKEHSKEVDAKLLEMKVQVTRINSSVELIQERSHRIRKADIG